MQCLMRPNRARTGYSTRHYLFSFLSFLSFFPPLSISRCPAFSASCFSVRAAKPAECFFNSFFCWMSFCFFGAIWRLPRGFSAWLPLPGNRSQQSTGAETASTYFFALPAAGFAFCLIVPWAILGYATRAGGERGDWRYGNIAEQIGEVKLGGRRPKCFCRLSLAHRSVFLARRHLRGRSTLLRLFASRGTAPSVTLAFTRCSGE